MSNEVKKVGKLTIGDAFNKLLRNPMFWVALVYLLFPVEFLPDATPVIGTVDDLLFWIISLVVQSKLSCKKV